MAVAVSRASPPKEARMADRESISVMSRSKPTGPLIAPLLPSVTCALCSAATVTVKP